MFSTKASGLVLARQAFWVQVFQQQQEDAGKSGVATQPVIKEG